MKPQLLRLSDWTRYPAGRYRSDGPYTGEQWREDFLVPALRLAQGPPKTALEIDLSSVRGWGSSFFEEAFGGLARHHLDLSLSVLWWIKDLPGFESEMREIVGYFSDEVQEARRVEELLNLK